MNFFAELLLFWFVSVKSTNGTQDGTFHIKCGTINHILHMNLTFQ